ncbi:hypothetical protein T11_6725 [Trichinella zimbabwensis]|uniref:Uncharacterized protein n=1 Tax=Trichinella zimbabwensis TaxID=268475 RepID=A0A0V1I4Y4_9BILA|nr:hypothetical protein T11_6725 [Trichinella zimbabwensis]
MIRLGGAEFNGDKIQSPDFQRTVDLSGSEKNKQKGQSYKQGRKDKKLTESTPERIHHHRPRVPFLYITPVQSNLNNAFCRQKHVVIIPTPPPELTVFQPSGSEKQDTPFLRKISNINLSCMYFVGRNNICKTQLIVKVETYEIISVDIDLSCMYFVGRNNICKTQHIVQLKTYGGLNRFTKALIFTFPDLLLRKRHWRANHFISAFVCHALCNFIGFPEPEMYYSLKARWKRSLVLYLTFIGILLWMMSLYPLTNPSLYGNKLFVL